MKFKSHLVPAIAASFVLFAAGCEQEGPVEETGETLQEGAEETGEQAEEIQEEVQR